MASYFPSVYISHPFIASSLDILFYILPCLITFLLASALLRFGFLLWRNRWSLPETDEKINPTVIVPAVVSSSSCSSSGGSC